MVEFEKQVAKEGFQTGRYTYEGKAGKPMTSKEGAEKTWRKVKLRMKKINSEYEHKFIMWTPLTSKKSSYKSEEELVEFDKEYDIVWVEENKKFENKEWVEKKIIIINDAKGELPQQTITQTQSIPQPKQEVPKIDAAQFIEMYFDTCKRKEIKPELTSFVGSYMLLNKTKLVELLEEAYNKAIENQQKVSEEKIKD